MLFIIFIFFIVIFIYIFITNYIIPHYLLNLTEDRQLMKVNNVKVTRNTLEVLTKSKYASVRKAIALCPKLDFNLYFHLYYLSTDDNKEEVLLLIAGREDISPDILTSIYESNMDSEDLVNTISQNKTYIEYEKKLQQKADRLYQIGLDVFKSKTKDNI